MQCPAVNRFLATGLLLAAGLALACGEGREDEPGTNAVHAQASGAIAPVPPRAAPGPEDSAAELAMLRQELAIPVAGVSASELRDSYDSPRSGGRRHEALDIPAPRGTPVLSAAAGRVLKLFTSKAGGLMVYAADTSERFILMYAHLDSYASGLAAGQSLRQGDTLGRVGTTGDAPPNLPHLHFAIARAVNVKQWWRGTPVNPYRLFAR